MQFKWERYKDTDAELVDSWLDAHAIHETGIDEGWQSFYDYWMNESKNDANWQDNCFLIVHENTPFGVIYVSIIEQELHISEYIVAHKIATAEAVAYSDNIASQKVFEKAGFILESKHPDDAWYYKYKADTGM